MKRTLKSNVNSIKRPAGTHCFPSRKPGDKSPGYSQASLTGLCAETAITTKIAFAETRDCEKMPFVKTLAYTYWQDGDFWLGYLDQFPDYWTQGESLNDLKDHLLDLYLDLAK